jgi:hypothetical protein
MTVDSVEEWGKISLLIVHEFLYRKKSGGEGEGHYENGDENRRLPEVIS